VAAPLTNRGRATRARIVSAAADLISERGAARTSLEDVRRAASVSGSQMTHYFPDKRSLVRSVIAYRTEQVLDFHTGPGQGTLDSFEALERWAALAVAQQVAQGYRAGSTLGSLAGELAETDEETRADLAAGYDHWAAVLGSGLRMMRARGDLRPDADPEQLTFALLAAHEGGALLTRTKREITPLRSALAAALAHIRSYAA
jgi:TetR/AcrR family transcriptional repressor of nem operon